MKEFWLTDDEIDKVTDYWWNEGGFYADGCLCGYFEYKVREDLYITIDTFCHKDCPKNMNWKIGDVINVYNESVESYGYSPDSEQIKEFAEEGDTLQHLGILNKEQTEELREVVRQSFAKHFTDYLDEYGNDIRKQDVFNENMEFSEKVEYVYNSIKNSFYIEGMLLNYVERNEFKLAIQKGIDDYEKNR